MSSAICRLRVPFGPFTASVWPSVVAVTPAGIATGFLPIRDISEHLRQHLAADILLTRFRVGENATRRRDDGDAEAVADPGQLLASRVDAAARLGHAGHVLDRRLSLEILQLDAQALVSPKRFFAVTADVALALKHVENAGAQLGS